MEKSNEINILIELSKKGDYDAFGQLVISHEKIVYNIAYKMMMNQDDAYDISQEVFIKAFKNIDRFDGKSSFKTWIYRIAVNTCLDELRKRKGKEVTSIDQETEGEENSFAKQFASEELTPEEHIIKNDTVEIVRNAVDKLSQEHKLMIVLRDFNGLSYDEIAQSVGISIGTVKSRLTRARKNLKDILVKSGELFDNSQRQNK